MAVAQRSKQAGVQVTGLHYLLATEGHANVLLYNCYRLSAAQQLAAVEDGIRCGVFSLEELLTTRNLELPKFYLAEKPKFTAIQLLPWNWLQARRAAQSTKLWRAKYREVVAQRKRIETLIAARRIWAEKSRIEAWYSADGRTFEVLAAASFRRLGFQVEMVGGSNDGGVDLRIAKNGLVTLVQCKAHARPISPATLRELVGAVAHEHAAGGVLLCLHGITAAGVDWIRGKPIKVLTPTDLLRLGG